MRFVPLNEELEQVLPYLRRDQPEEARAVLERDPELITTYGGTLLNQALALGCFPIVRFLLVDKGIRARDPVLNCALDPLAHGDVSATLAAVEHDPTLLKADRFGGKSLLELAMILNCLPVVRSLILDRGIRLKKDILKLSSRNYGNLPLRIGPQASLFIFSCRLGFLEISQFLFHHDIASLDTRDKVLIEAISDVESHANAVEYIDWLVSVGADVNQEVNAATPLLSAAVVGANSTIEALIRHGAQVNHIVGGRGRNSDALFAAVINHHPKTVLLLLHHGAHPFNTSVRALKNWPNSPHGNALEAARMIQNQPHSPDPSEMEMDWIARNEEVVAILTEFLANNGGTTA